MCSDETAGQGGRQADLIIRGGRLVGVLDVVGGGEDVARLLDGVLDLAGDEEGSEGGILVVIFCVAEVESEFVEVDTGGIEGPDGPDVRLDEAHHHDKPARGEMRG